MSRQVNKVMKEVEVVTLLCDLCGQDLKLRYRCNFECYVCGREVCAKCQYVPDGDFEESTICKVCHSLESLYQPKINETYLTRDMLQKEWKSESLRRKHAGD